MGVGNVSHVLESVHVFWAWGGGGVVRPETCKRGLSILAQSRAPGMNAGYAWALGPERLMHPSFQFSGGSLSLQRCSRRG